MEYKVDGTDLNAVANAIRTKGSTSASLEFPDGFVAAIGNIAGGGSLITKSITENGTYAASSDSAEGYSSVTVNVAPTSSKMVSGTFTGDTAGAMEITVPYNGNGYPIAGLIFPSSGSWELNSGIPALVRQNAIIMFGFAKMDISTTPDYTSNTDNNKVESFYFYKSSDSNPDTTGGGRTHQNRMFNSGTNASGYTDSIIRIKSATKMSVYTADSGVGFIKDVPYTYMLIYSA